MTATISDSIITATVPYTASISSLVANFTTSGSTVFVDDTVQTSGTTANDFSSPVTYTVTAEDGTTQTYTVIVEVSIRPMSAVSPSDGSATAELSSALSWDAIDGATGYEVQIASTEDGVASATAETTTTTSLTPANNPAGVYWYWRVRAMNGSEALSQWSETASLILNFSNISVTQSGPDSGTATTDTTPALSWTAICDTASYEIQIATSSTSVSSATAVLSGTASYTYGSPQDNNTTYYWRVRAAVTDAVTGAAVYSEYSITRNYTLDWSTDGPFDGICFAEELEELAGDSALYGGSYTLNADLDLSSVVEWTPIGNTSNAFTGSFDGGGHTISGLTITAGNYVGLFGYISGATIKDLNLSGVSISATTHAGALAGLAYGNNTLTGCSTAGDVATSGNYSGGLLGSCSNKTVGP